MNHHKLHTKIERRRVFEGARAVIPALIRGENSAQRPSQRRLYAELEQHKERRLLRYAGCADFPERSRV